MVGVGCQKIGLEEYSTDRRGTTTVTRSKLLDIKQNIIIIIILFAAIVEDEVNYNKRQQETQLMLRSARALQICYALPPRKLSWINEKK